MPFLLCFFDGQNGGSPVSCPSDKQEAGEGLKEMENVILAIDP